MDHASHLTRQRSGIWFPAVYLVMLVLAVGAFYLIRGYGETLAPPAATEDATRTAHAVQSRSHALLQNPA